MGEVDELNSQLGVLSRRALARRRPRAAVGDPARALQPRRRAVDPRLRAAEERGRRPARHRARALQRHPAAPEGIHPSGRHRAVPRSPTSAARVARRAERAVVGPGGDGDGTRRAAPVPQPPQRPAVRPRPGAQPRQPRRASAATTSTGRASGWRATATERRAPVSAAPPTSQPTIRARSTSHITGSRPGARTGRISTASRSASERLR